MENFINKMDQGNDYEHEEGDHHVQDRLQK
jgi:hypothetical protein